LPACARKREREREREREKEDVLKNHSKENRSINNNDLSTTQRTVMWDRGIEGRVQDRL
jgi:hypothetical protein